MSVDRFIVLVAACYFAAILEFLGAQRCLRDLQYCQDRFMAKSGWSRSLFGYWLFFGRPAAARKAIIENAKLRRWLIIEIYCRAFAFLVLGTYILLKFL
jgi:hypothetical protein